MGVTALLLLLTVGLTMFLADWGEIASSLFTNLAILFGVVGLFAWHTSIAYLRRRMGMTRLAVILGYFFFSTVTWYYSTSKLRTCQPFPEAVMHVAGAVWPWQLTLSIISGLWLCILTFWRPPDLCRWSPTGKVWNTYRTKLVVTSEHQGLNSLGTVGRLSDIE